VVSEGRGEHRHEDGEGGHPGEETRGEEDPPDPFGNGGGPGEENRRGQPEVVDRVEEAAGGGQLGQAVGEGHAESGEEAEEEEAELGLAGDSVGGSEDELFPTGHGCEGERARA